MSVVRSVLATTGIILVNCFIVLVGIGLFLNPQLAMEAIRYYFIIFFVVKGGSFLLGYYFKRDAKQKHLLFQGAIFLSMAIIFASSQKVTAISLVSSIMLVLLIDGLLKMVTAYQYKKGNMENWVYPLISGAISLIFVLIIIFTYGTSELLIIQAGAVYICWGAIADSYDIVFRGQTWQQAMKRWNINVLYIRRDILEKASLPAEWMKRIEEKVAVENDFQHFLQTEKIEKQLPMEGYTTIKVHIHSWDDDVLKMQGHSDISIDGFCYSYGNYDMSKSRLNGSWSEGCLVIADEKPYIDYCLEVEKKIIIEYTLRISREQREKLQKFIDKLMDHSEEWTVPIVEKPDITATDPASLLYNVTKAKFYKLVETQFKYYFVLSTNCVRFVEQVLHSIKLEDPDINGVMMPGDYIAFFERKLADLEDTEVLAREVLAIPTNIHHS